MYSNNSSVFMLLLDILTEQQNALRKISPEIYTFAVPSLDGASIGGHTRHSIEFLEILLNSYSTNIINYEKRKRNFVNRQSPLGKSIYPMRRKTPCVSYGDIRRVHRIYASN